MSWDWVRTLEADYTCIVGSCVDMLAYSDTIQSDLCQLFQPPLDITCPKYSRFHKPVFILI